MFESYLEHLKGVREAALPFENEEAVSLRVAVSLSAGLCLCVDAFPMCYMQITTHRE